MSGYYNLNRDELKAVGQTSISEPMPVEPVAECAEGETCPAVVVTPPKYQSLKMLKVPEADEETIWYVVVSTSTNLAQEFAVLPVTLVLPPRKVEVIVEVATTIGIFLACVIVFVILF